jgi:YVTN family beta-propeller protein
MLRPWLRRAIGPIGLALGAALLTLAAVSASGIARAGAVRPAATYTHPTYSSPIALSADNRLLWAVNPDDDSVSVLRTDTNAVIKTIRVGDEPQSIALDPNNAYAYVANAAANTVAVIRINDSSWGSFDAAVDTSSWRNGYLATGAEPWNIVISPDGKRVFVANSAQDTITVIDATTRRLIGSVDLRNSRCNDPDRDRHFQPRGLAVTQDSNYLYVTRFLSFTREGGVQADDGGKEGLVCRLDIDTDSTNIAGYVVSRAIRLAARDTGFAAQIGNPPVATPTSGFPNQLQSIVIRGNSAYLPNIAASPTRPLKFNVDTHAFVNRIDNIGASETDAGAINLHLGARVPEAGKKKLFFANPWAVAFTTQSGAGNAYVVASGSDLLVKLNVAADGTLSNIVNATTTRYIDLNDPANPATSGANAGKNPIGIVINDAGTTAYVLNFVSRNLSVVDLATDSVAKVVKLTDLPPPGSQAERILVGAEMFFSSRGNFVLPAGVTVAGQERLSSEGWQNCASCHFKGLTDGVVWTFETGPRKSIPMNGTVNPHDPNDQRLLNYSAVRDEVQDFELNTRNISGPGALAAPVPCSDPAPGGANTSTFDPNHGLLLGDTDPNKPPCVINNFAKPNSGRNQVTVRLPGSTVAVPAQDAINEWVKFAIRTPNRPLTTIELTLGGGDPTGGLNVAAILAGRTLFFRAGCQTCHGGGKWTISTKNFTSLPPAADVASENQTVAPNANPAQFLFGALRDIGSFNLNVLGQGNLIPGQPAIGGVELDAAGKLALGKDHDGDGKGNGYNVPSLLGLHQLPPYYHNGACETLACVLADVRHRTAGLGPGQPDLLVAPEARAALVRFLESIDARTPAANTHVPLARR